MIEVELYMTPEEIKQLRTVTEARCITDLSAGRSCGVTAWMLIDFVSALPLRVGEIASVKIEDFDLKKNSLRVVRLKRARKRKNKAGKVLKVYSVAEYNKMNMESVPVVPGLVDHIEAYVKWTGRTSGPLFLSSRTNKALSIIGLQQNVKSSIRRAGLPTTTLNSDGSVKVQGYSIHSLRHTWGVISYAKNQNVRQCQKMLGHKDVNTTMSMYCDVSHTDMVKLSSGIYDEVQHGE